jgi:hypothetical protein
MIYPGPGIQHYVEDRVEETRRTYRGIAALLGWDWPGAQDPDRPVATPGDALPFRLYWEYLGKVPEERFFFRLVGSDGRTWAEDLSQPVPSENDDPASWRQGQIITEAGELRLPPGTPPGEYRLEIGFYTQAPAVTAGELIFAVPPEDARVHVAGAAPGQASPALPVPHRPAVDLAELRLLGASEREARLIPEEAWTADVYWQAASAPQGDYQARLSLVDAEGQTRWIWGAQPLVAFYPTSHWQPGQVIRSQMTITPTLRTPGGDFDLTMTLLDERGQPVDRTRLGPARVEGRARAFNLPPVAARLDATFGDAIELVGFNDEPPLSQLRPGDEVALTLVWRALAPLEADYVVTVQLLGPDGGVYGQRDASPLEGAAPTSTWSPGEILVDEYRFAVSSDAPPGEYRLLAAMYRPESGERLPVGDGGDSLTLASIQVTQ